jgi:hypothetical protein
LGVKEGINEDTRENEESVSNTNLEKIIPPPSYTSSSTIREKEQKPNNKSYHRNLQTNLHSSFRCTRERKARSILTILMVVAGGGLMVALNGMSAGVLA